MDFKVTTSFLCKSDAKCTYCIFNHNIPFITFLFVGGSKIELMQYTVACSNAKMVSVY